MQPTDDGSSLVIHLPPAGITAETVGTGTFAIVSRHGYSLVMPLTSRGGGWCDTIGATLVREEVVFARQYRQLVSRESWLRSAYYYDGAEERD